MLLPETIRPKRILDSAALSARADEITAWHATRHREAMEKIKKEGVLWAVRRQSNQRPVGKSEFGVPVCQAVDCEPASRNVTTSQENA